MAGYLDNYISNYAAITAPLYQLTQKDTKFKWEKKEEKAFKKIQESISNEKTGIFWLIQTYNPAHRSKLQPRLISSPTAKDWQGYTASAFHQSQNDRKQEKIWPNRERCTSHQVGKERLRVYLLGAPRFRMVTAHKPLLPLFNKVKATMPPRIEK